MLPLKNLMRRKARSLFAVLQIAVAIAAYVSIVGVTKGLQAQFYRIGQVFAFDLIVQSEGAASPVFSAVKLEDVETIAQTEGVKGASAMGLYYLRDFSRPQPVGFVALEPGSELMRRYEVYRGRTLEPTDSNHIVIGELMAEMHGIDTTNLTPEGLVGEPPVLSVGGYSFKVVGLFRSPLEEVPFLAGMGIMPMGYYASTFKPTANLVVAHIETGRKAGTVREVQQALERGRKVAPNIKVKGLKAATIEDFLDSFKQVEIVNSFALAISLLAALVSVIGVANTMLMSVFDRTREIGLLRAIGWSRWRIVGMIEAEGIILSLTGGLLGIPFGLALIEASRFVIEGGWLNVSLDLRLYGTAVGVAMLIGLGGSLYPALRAAYLPPTEALRYE